MSLLILPADAALRGVRGAKSRWPRTLAAQADRLTPMAQPVLAPSFHIEKPELTFAVGCSFARNIEEHLIRDGFNIAPPGSAALGDSESVTDTRALLERPGVFSIANEIQWAIGRGRQFDDGHYIELGPDRWVDPHHASATEPSPLATVRRRREAVRRYFAGIAQAQVVIMTLSSAESWYDATTSLYVKDAPPAEAFEREPGRFEFHILDYHEVLEELNFINCLLKTYGQPNVKVLVAVSPVAMDATFAGGDVLVGNSYSKSVLRAATEAFVVGNPNVDYFPGYETVLLSDRQLAWRRDQRHASDGIIRSCILRLIEAYGGEAGDGPKARENAQDPASDALGLVRTAKVAARRGEVEAAMKAFQAALRRAPKEGLIHLEYGGFLFDQGLIEEARRRFKASIRLGVSGPEAYHQLARAQFALERYEEAFWAAKRARQLQPQDPELLYLYADLAERLGRHGDALAVAECCVELAPTSELFQQLLRKLTEAQAARGA